MRKRRWIWLVLWLLSLVGISFYGGAASYGLFFALTLIPVVSFLYLLCVFARFKIYQEVESREMVCGQAMPYYFILRNEDKFGFAGVNVRMFPDFSYVEDVAEDIEYELLPGDEFLYRTKIVCRYRGEYEVGVREAVVTDFFRIFRFRYKVVGTIRAIVRPKLVELNEITGLSEVTVDLQKESLISKTEPDVVVRDYVRGDSLNRIHWKATAREQKLKVRTDTGEEKQGIRILFDTKRYNDKPKDYLPLESKILEILLALGMFFAERNVTVSAYYAHNGVQRCDITGMRSFEDFYARMSGLYFEEENDPEALFGQLYEQGVLSDTKVVIGVFHRWNDAMMHWMEQLSVSGVIVLVYLVTDENMDEYMRQNTARKKVIVIPTDGELEGVL